MDNLFRISFLLLAIYRCNLANNLADFFLLLDSLIFLECAFCILFSLFSEVFNGLELGSNEPSDITANSLRPTSTPIVLIEVLFGVDNC